MTESASADGTVAQRIRKVRHTLARGELRVVAALTDGYPTAGLVPIAQLAAAADVSAPTVLRLVGKLGFAGYRAFQEALRDEVQMRLFSPVNVYPSDDETVGFTDSSELAAAAALYSEGLRATLTSLPADELDLVVSTLADPSRQVMLIGGRFTTVLAAQLSQYLRLLRGNVVLVSASSAERMASLIDVNDRTVVVAFDYRRYQPSTVDWGIAAIGRGGHLIVVTDMYLSPLSSHAHAVLPTSHAGLGPFDSMAHGFMLVELLVSLVAKVMGEPARQRLADFEQLQLAADRERRRTPPK